MRRAAPAVVVVVAIAAACGDPSATQVATQSSDVTIEQPLASTTPSTRPPPTVPPAATPATRSALEPPRTEATTAAPAPTMYRPEPVRSGALVTARIVPVDGVTLDGSTVTFQIVEMPDGRFLQVDRENAAVPAGAEFWTTTVNGRLKMKTNARQGGLAGSRIDPEVYGDAFTVSFNAITGTDEVLASTGEVRMSE